jgi:hypothetical protein
MRIDTTPRWTTVIAGIVFALVLGPFGAVLVASLGTSREPASGSVLAFLVVASATYFVPSHRALIGTIVLLVGAAVAWKELSPPTEVFVSDGIGDGSSGSYEVS